jgi:two-component system, cell cycle sensor histidine kinase and response regulator CckA
MNNPFIKIKKFTSSLGLVEQSQVVASTAVIVLLGTIIGINFFAGQELEWRDFFTLITVGLFGFLIVYFIARYGLQINEQHQQLLALNAIAHAVSRSVELNTVLQNSLEKVCELSSVDFGWIYLVQDEQLELKHQYKIKLKFLPDAIDINSKLIQSLKLQPDPVALIVSEGDYHELQAQDNTIGNALKKLDIQSWVSMPLERGNEFVGMIILASKSNSAFSRKKLDLLTAFGNHISVALNNAYLFQQLKQSEQLYADLYEKLPDMYHSINREGIIVSCNTTEANHLGFPKEELIGHNVKKLYPPDKQNSILEKLESIFKNRAILKDSEELMLKKNGEAIYVSVNTSIVYDLSDDPLLVRVVARDITNQKKMEQKIIQAQKIDSIGNLAGGVAHDFNNILNSILGPASMMKRKLQETDKLYKYVNLIEDSARRGASVTRQLLTFSRKSNTYFRPLDINNVIEDTVRLFERSVPKSTRISWTPSAKFVIVNADSGQLEQAFLNLFLNARDAMPNGGVITISCKAVSLTEPVSVVYSDIPPGSYVQIKVVDTGSGITKEVLPKIFEPFFTTKEQSKGTGLGLSVVYGVVKSHDGYLGVESEIGIGTAFTIHLPRIEKFETIQSELKSTKISGGSEKILLVDDDPGANIIGVDILQELGYSVDTVKDGFQAIEKIQNDIFYDLVILDLNMPGIGGKDVFYSLKKLKPSLKVMICSGYSNSILNDDAFIKAVNGYLHKPYMYEELARSVRDVLDNNN